jgi:hypothetical protein
LDNVAYAHGAVAIGGLGIEAWINQSDNYVENSLGSTMV